MSSTALTFKWDKLQEYLRSLESVAVAFSGGVDSTFLLKAAKEALGEQAIAITAISCTFPKREREEAEDFCKREGITQIECESEELDIDGFRQNPKDRCYLCKKELFTKMIAITKEKGIREIVEGSNLDDNGDYRPGLLAVAELGVKSPLREVGFTKSEIRALSKELGLPTWEKPSFACLSSRFVYGETITEEKLQWVDQAEQFLIDQGFRQVRVRIHGTMARIEILPEEFERFLESSMRERIHTALKQIGFSYVTLDLLGYRTGSMNETLLADA